MRLYKINALKREQKKNKAINVIINITAKIMVLAAILMLAGVCDDVPNTTATINFTDATLLSCVAFVIGGIGVMVACLTERNIKRSNRIIKQLSQIHTR